MVFFSHVYHEKKHVVTAEKICPNAPKYLLRACLEAKALLQQNEAQTLSEGKLNLTQFMLDAYFKILKDI